MEPIAYTYEASEHCTDCATARFGEDTNGYVPEIAQDSEGNTVGAVFDPFEERDMVCGTCHDLINKIHEN
jgi:hypothetical protein